LFEDIREVRIPPELLARWALDSPAPAQEATYSALCLLVQLEHAAATLLPVPHLLRSEQAVQDPDGFLRIPRGALEHFRHRAVRAMGWMDQLIFFRERFPAAAQREPAESLFTLAQIFSARGTAQEASIDLLVRESVLPEIEDILARTVTYPGLQLLMERLRENDGQRSSEGRRLAAEVLGELTATSVWGVRRRLVTTATRAILGSRPLFEEMERGGLKVDRARAARGFARRLEEAVSELAGVRVLPVALIARLAGKVETGAGAEPQAHRAGRRK
jgi:hypothetical protein